MPVGYVYDPIYLQHDTGRHPENADRLRSILRHLEGAGLLAELEQLPARPATEEDLLRAHEPAMVARVRRTSERGGGHLDADTPVGPRSYEAALYAAGGTMAATEALLEGRVDSAYALVRPPGHHATSQRSMGFCLFNNVAVAAAWALETQGLQRVAIVDFDLHHGNGTADIFAADPRVLYVSTHQYPFYPGTGHWRERGQGAGQGTELNIPLPAGVGDDGYAMAYERLALPLLRRFRPELMLVSAGYDAHWADPLAWMLLSIDGYRRIVELLLGAARELCPGRLVFCLEGGYHSDALSHGVATTFAALLDRPYADPLGPANEPEEEVEARLEEIARYHELT